MGRGSHDQVMRAAGLLRAHGVEFNILCTVHAANGDHPVDVYRFFRDEVKADWVQYIPIVERAPDGSVTDRSVGPEQLGRFLIGTFDEWVRRDVGLMFVQEFEVALGAWLGRPAGLCVHAPTCGQNVAMEHNGDVYACDHFVNPEDRLGNIHETPLPDLIFSEQQNRFGEAKKTDLPLACRDCDVLFACHGGCPKDRLVQTPEEGHPLNYLCPGYYAFFHHIAPAMEGLAGLLEKGRPPEEIMRIVALEDEKSSPYAHVGRNDPCPCGSGVKFKKCHGAA